MPFMFVLGFVGFVSALTLRVSEPMVPLLAQDLNVDTHAIALLSSAFTLPYALGQPFLGPFGDSRGKERIIILALALVTLALFASALTPNYTALAVFRVLNGLAAGGVIPLSLALIGDRSPMAERQLAISRYLVAVIGGQIVGAPAAGLISDYFGWRAVFFAATAVVALATLLAWHSLRPDKVKAATPMNIRAGYARVLANPKAKICFISVLVEGIFVFGFFPFVATGLQEAELGGVREAGFVIGGIGIGGVLFSVLAGRLLARFGRRDVMMIGGCLVFIAFVAAGLSPSWQAQLVSFTGIGCGFYMLHSALQTEATELAPDARGSAVALHAFFFFIGQAVGPFYYGIALSAFGLVFTTFIAGGAICLVAFLARYFLIQADIQRPR